MTPSGASLDKQRAKRGDCHVLASRHLHLQVTGRDAANLSTIIERDAAVYGPDGLSTFDTAHLEPFWNMENVAIRTNYTTGPYYSLTEVPGTLVLQVWNDRAFPLAAASPKYPLIWRALPPATDWAFLSTLLLRGQVFSDYMTGILVETKEGGSPCGTCSESRTGRCSMCGALRPRVRWSC